MEMHRHRRSTSWVFITPREQSHWKLAWILFCNTENGNMIILKRRLQHTALYNVKNQMNAIENFLVSWKPITIGKS
jgi:hypothetical protein